MADVTPEKQQEVLTFLRHHPMAVLSTVNGESQPWGSAIYYVVDGEFNFYFVTRVGTLKYQNIEQNPHVALTVADNDRQTTVQASGLITKVPVEDYMDIVFDKLAKIRPKDDPHWAPPLTKIREGNYMPLKLTPSKLQYANYKDRKSDINEEYIEKIIGA